MLRHVGVRTKLLTVLAIPMVLLVAVTTLLVSSQVSAARRAGQVKAMTQVAVQLNRVVHGLQQERSVTLGFLQDPSSANKRRMAGQRAYVDHELVTLREILVGSPINNVSAGVTKAAAQSTAAHAEIVGARRSIDRHVFFGTEADTFYTHVIQTDLRLPGVLAESGTAELGSRLRAYQALSSVIEYAAHERDILGLAYLRGSILQADYAKVAGLAAQQRQILQDFQQVATPAVVNALDGSLVRAQNQAVDEARKHAADLLTARSPDVGGSAIWLSAANSRIEPMTVTESQLVTDVATAAAAARDREQGRALLLAAAAVVGLGTAIVLAVALARRISRPLRRLTVAAAQIGEELPHMVERMQTPGEGPGVVIEPIPVESHDEIGRLAEAFNTVNEVTVQVARDQAALRASIAEMFVNVARRNQVLLGRQLSQIDTMESREEDPDVLESLFRLDHLATRMRRNAESLLVLAGIDSTRRLRNAVPLSDVIRTAVGEIESFQRVDLSMTADPEVSGRVALPLAHLLAELLENATHFSDPETRVVVSAAVSTSGVELSITDKGLGMSDEELASANQDIAEPPLAGIAVSQRLGLFVVGRLAQRLGATVALRRGRGAGTVAGLSLPAALFEGMAVTDTTPDAGTEAAADAATGEATAEAQPGPALSAAAIPAVGPPLQPQQSHIGRSPSLPQRDRVSGPATRELPSPPLEDAPAPAPAPLPEPVTQALPAPPSPGPQLPVVPIEPTDPAPAFLLTAAIDILPGRPVPTVARQITAPEPPAPPAQQAPPAPPAPPVEQTPPAPPAPPVQQAPPAPPAPPAPRPSPFAPPAPPTPAAGTAPVPDPVPVPVPVPAPVHVPVPAPPVDVLADLPGLYEPAPTPDAPAQPVRAVEGLARRTPKSAAAPAPTPDDAPLGAPRPRSADNVRGMLSGFRAGVQRGRSTDQSAAADNAGEHREPTTDDADADTEPRNES
jgi:anti-sigma regulatory factor (Ser/Thr protein kinase)